MQNVDGGLEEAGGCLRDKRSCTTALPQAQVLHGSATRRQEHINKVTTLAEQLEAIGAPISDEDIAMTLLCSLSESYDNLIIAVQMTFLLSLSDHILQEEIRRKDNSTGKQEESAFFARSGKEKVDGQTGDTSKRSEFYSRIHILAVFKVKPNLWIGGYFRRMAWA